MLVIKNKSISLRWEMNSILMQIYQKNCLCIDHQHGRLVTWLQTKNNKPWHYICSKGLILGEAYFLEGLTIGGNFAFLKRANSPNFQQSMGLYSGGLIFGRIFASEIWGAFFFQEDLFRNFTMRNLCKKSLI